MWRVSTHLEADARLLLPILPREGLQLHHGHADQTHAGRLDLVHALRCRPAARAACELGDQADLALECAGPWHDTPLAPWGLQEGTHGIIVITQHQWSMA